MDETIDIRSAAWRSDQRLGDGARVVTLTGRLDRLAAAVVRRELETQAVALGLVVVDLSAVTAVDSSGISALILGLKAARMAGGDLRLATPSEPVRALLQLTRLDRVLRPYDSIDEAINGAMPQPDRHVMSVAPTLDPPTLSERPPTLGERPPTLSERPPTLGERPAMAPSGDLAAGDEAAEAATAAVMEAARPPATRASERRRHSRRAGGRTEGR